jgi:hypothetical protein
VKNNYSNLTKSIKQHKISLTVIIATKQESDSSPSKFKP